MDISATGKTSPLSPFSARDGTGRIESKERGSAGSNRFRSLSSLSSAEAAIHQEKIKQIKAAVAAAVATYKAGIGKSAQGPSSTKEIVEGYYDLLDRGMIEASDEAAHALILDSIAEHESGIESGGLSNNGQDCYMNSSFQLLKALDVDTSSFKTTRLANFLCHPLTSDEECCGLRAEVASNLELDERQDFGGSIVDGTARSQQDAAVFLGLLLNKLPTPKIHLKGKIVEISGKGKNFYDLQEETEPSSMLRLSLPPAKKSDEQPISMQEIVGHSCFSEMPSPSPGVKATKEMRLGDPIPPALVVSVGRYEFDGSASKRKDVVAGALEPVILPREDGSDMSYEPTAIICHRGDSTKSGHYVCYRKEGDDWYLYNDALRTKVDPTDKRFSDDVRQNCYVISYNKNF